MGHDICGQHEFVIVDRYGIVDPVRGREPPSGAVASELALLAIPLVLCAPAAWPRRRPKFGDPRPAGGSIRSGAPHPKR
jgi:hypothetical protein